MIAEPQNLVNRLRGALTREHPVCWKKAWLHITDSALVSHDMFWHVTARSD